MLSKHLLLCCMLAYDLIYYILLFFETMSHYVAQAGLHLPILLSSLPSAVIVGVCHQAWLSYCFLYFP
jgi:hypothetical protein